MVRGGRIAVSVNIPAIYQFFYRSSKWNIFISGKEIDLSAFGCDVKNFQHVALALQKKRLKIYLNNALILDTEQPKGIGNVVGIRFEFEGAGEIKDVKLASKGKVAYKEKF